MSNNGTVVMSHHAHGLRAGTDGRAWQARAASADRLRARIDGSGGGVACEDGWAGTSKAGQTWQTDGRAGGQPKSSQNRA